MIDGITQLFAMRDLLIEKGIISINELDRKMYENLCKFYASEKKDNKNES
jgi:hypothetical protein